MNFPNGDYDYVIPVWAYEYATQGYSDNTTEKEEKQVDNFLKEVAPAGCTLTAVGESYFSYLNDIDNLGGDVIQVLVNAR